MESTKSKVSPEALASAKQLLANHKGDLDDTTYHDGSGHIEYHFALCGDDGFVVGVTYNPKDVAINFRTRNEAIVRLSEMVAALAKLES
jgi:hypothetical protein